MPKINQSTETRIVDNLTGEVIKNEVYKKLSWGSEPSFIKLYLNDILYLSDMPTKHSAVLYELLKRSTYASEEDGMQVVVSAGLKQRIKDILGFKNISSINNAITDLVKGNILYRVGTGLYNFNPYLFGKGEWIDIAKLRLEINYDDIKGKTFKAVCEYYKDNINETSHKEYDTTSKTN